MTDIYINMVALRTKATQVNPFRLIGRPIRPYSLRATQSVAPFLFAAPFVIVNRLAVASSLPSLLRASIRFRVQR